MIRYKAEVSGVQDVVLAGAADFDYWQERLAPYGMAPARVDGAAGIQIIVAHLVWAGISFQELSVAISVADLDDPDGKGPLDGAVFLAQAFNSSRVFTFFERHWFRTPYQRARVRINSVAPCAVSVESRSGELFRAEMSAASARQEPRTTEECWEGAIYLPRSTPTRRVYFLGRIGGPTTTFAYAPDDRLTFNPVPDAPIFTDLQESNFTGQEWRLCHNAHHAKSKTYRAEVSASSGPLMVDRRR